MDKALMDQKRAFLSEGSKLLILFLTLGLGSVSLFIVKDSKAFMLRKIKIMNENFINISIKKLRKKSVCVIREKNNK